MGGCSKLFFKVEKEPWQSSVQLKVAFFCVKAGHVALWSLGGYLCGLIDSH